MGNQHQDGRVLINALQKQLNWRECFWVVCKAEVLAITKMEYICVIKPESEMFILIYIERVYIRRKEPNVLLYILFLLTNYFKLFQLFQNRP